MFDTPQLCPCDYSISVRHDAYPWRGMWKGWIPWIPSCTFMRRLLSVAIKRALSIWWISSQHYQNLLRCSLIFFLFPLSGFPAWGMLVFSVLILRWPFLSNFDEQLGSVLILLIYPAWFFFLIFYINMHSVQLRLWPCRYNTVYPCFFCLAVQTNFSI